jgi:hypothetical protein
MLNLPQVTLVCVEGTEKENSIIDAINALRVSSHYINFGEILLISPTLPIELPKNIKHININKITWIEYNQFIISELYKYINTEYCILIQTDGFILNAHLWTNEFLKYDYIGHAFDFINCPWQINGVDPKIVEQKGILGLNRVGNGGFSFRSKKLLKTTSEIPYKCEKGEDAFICNDNYDFLIKKEIKFASVEIADLFSKDYSKYNTDTFGFHGNKEILKNIYEYGNI